MAVVQGRTRSSDRPEESFPISQLKDAAGMARLVDRRGGRMRYDDLAAVLGQQRNSGAFRGKTAAGQMFGLIETVSREASLTDLGRRVAAPDTEADALAEAFLHVPLYRALYGRYAADGGKLPMIRDIDVDIERLGVSPNRVTKARQVFLASAETAGYFRSGRDRLIRPSSANPGAAAGTILSGRGTLTGGAPERKEPAEVSHAEAEPMSAPALMQNLMATLPPQGERYSPKQRQRWLEAAKTLLDIVYATDDEESDPASARLNGLASAHSQPS